MGSSDLGPLSAATCRECGAQINVQGMSPDQVQRTLLEHASRHRAQASSVGQGSLADIFDQASPDPSSAFDSRPDSSADFLTRDTTREDTQGEGSAAGLGDVFSDVSPQAASESVNVEVRSEVELGSQTREERLSSESTQTVQSDQTVQSERSSGTDASVNPFPTANAPSTAAPSSSGDAPAAASPPGSPAGGPGIPSLPGDGSIRGGAEEMVKKGIQSKTGNAATGGAEKNVVNAVSDIAKTAADKNLTGEEKFDQAAYTVGKEGSKAAAKAGLAYMGAGAAADPLIENPLGDKLADQFGKSMQRNANAIKKGSKYNPAAQGAKKALTSAPVKKVGEKAKASVGKNMKRLGKAAKPITFVAGMPQKAQRIAIVSVVLVLLFSVVTVGVGTLAAITTSPEAQDSYLWAVPPDAVSTDIPEPYLAAYMRAGRATNVPWTLLAAVGGQASAHGRVDPYKQDVPPPAFVSSGQPLSVLAGAQAPSNEVLVLTTNDGPGFVQELTKSFDGSGLAVNVKTTSVPTVDWARDQVKSMELPLGSRVVVNLGRIEAESNNSTFASSASKLAQALDGQQVTWLTVDTPGKGGDNVNRVLTDDIQVLPHVTLVNWAGSSSDSYRDKPTPAKPTQSSSSSSSQGPAATTKPVPPSFVPLNSAGVAAKVAVLRSAASGEVAASVLGQPAGGGLTGPGVLPEPTGSCPIVDPAIAGKKLDRGFGPLMLSPSALGMTNVSETEQLQDICVSSGLLAQAMAREAVTVAGGMGLRYPSSFQDLVPAAQQGDAQAAQIIQTFWAKVMSNLTILGTTDKRDCRIEPQPEEVAWDSYVAGSIRSIWACVLDGTELNMVYSVQETADGFEYKTLSQSEARRRAIDEAVEVAWLYSQWGKALEPPAAGEKPAAGECDPTQPLVGVFPLTSATFKQYLPEHLEGRTRCDVEASITAAAFAFADRESVPPADRLQGYQAAYGGWFSFAATVVGPKPIQDAFSQAGPYRPVDVDATCVDSVGPIVSVALSDPANPLRSVPPAQLGLFANGKGKLPPTVASQLVVYLSTSFDGVAALDGCAATAQNDAAFWTLLVRAIGQADGDPDNPAAPTTPAPSASPEASSSPGASPTAAANPTPGASSTSPSSSAGPAASPRPATPRASGAPAPAVITPAMIAKTMSRFAAEKIKPVVPAVRKAGSTALLSRLSPAALTPANAPAVVNWAPVTDKGTERLQLAMSAYGGLFPSGPVVAGGLFTGANCPQTVPANTLRDGSEAIGAYALCTQAVAQAATPQAALAIQWAFNNLGKTYAWPVGVPRDGPDMYDCSSFVSHAYYDTAGIGIAGESWSHSTRNQMPWDGVELDPHYVVVPAGQERPGDLVMQRTSSTTSQHVLMYLGVVDGVQWVAHTNMPGDVSKVEDMPSSGVDSGSFRRVVPTSAEEEASIAAAAAALGSAPTGPTGPLPAAGTGGVWLAKFLSANGMRGPLLRTVWAIGMRESNARPNLTTNSAVWNWNSSDSPHYDVGVFQINNRNLPTVRRLFGANANMEDMKDPQKNFLVSRELSKNWTNFLPWGLTPDGRFDWSYYDSDWLSRYQASSEAGFRQWFTQFPEVARQAGIPAY